MTVLCQRQARAFGAAFAFCLASTVTLASGGNAAPSPAATVPEGVYKALAPLVPSCEENVPAGDAFNVTPVHLSSGRTEYVAHAVQSCGDPVVFAALIANARGAYALAYLGYVGPGEQFRDGADSPRSGLSWKFRADGSAVIDSRFFLDERLAMRETLQLEGDTYHVVRDEFELRATGATKPVDPVPVSFARGASSVTLGGKVEAGFDDTYSLFADAGQTMTIHVSATSGRLAPLEVDEDGVLTSGEGSQTWSGTFASSGTHYITVEGADRIATDAYTMSVAIR